MTQKGGAGMNRIYNALQRHKGIAIALIVLGVAAVLLANRAISSDSSEVVTLEPTPTPYPEQTWQINQSLTIGDFTVNFVQAKDTANGLRLSRTYETNIPETDYLPIGSYAIRYPNGSIALADDGLLPGAENDLDVSLGSFLVPDYGLTGSVDIPLASLSESGGVSPEPELSIGEKIYRITHVSFAGDQIAISVQPISESAKRSLLGVAADAPVDATLTDDAGKSYGFLFGSMNFEHFDQAVDTQELAFYGIERESLSSATKLTLTVRGGGEIVGPFVFDNIALVSEDAPPPADELPIDEPDPGDGTPVNVSN